MCDQIEVHVAMPTPIPRVESVTVPTRVSTVVSRRGEKDKGKEERHEESVVRKRKRKKKEKQGRSASQKKKEKIKKKLFKCWYGKKFFF